MRILLGGYACSPFRGGEAGGTWHWAWNLAKSHEVWALVHPHDRDGVEQYLSTHPHPSLHVVFVKPLAALHPLRPALGGRGLRLRFVLWQRAALREARRLHSRHRFDVAHHVSWGTVSAPPSLWKLGVPFVWGPIGGGHKAPGAFRSYYGRAWPREIARSLRLGLVPFLPGVQAAVRESAALLATNYETAGLLQRAGARRVPLFLDCGICKEALPSSSPERSRGSELKLLWAGRLDAGKALPLALEALRLLDGVPARLVVAGEGPMRSEWQRCASRMGLQDRVQFLGFVKWERMFDVYRQADTFLFTSLRDSFGSVLLEAMAQGLPIVALNHQGVRAFVPPEASIKVPVTKPEETVNAIANAIRELWHAPERRQRMGVAAWEFARTETWERRATRMTEIYGRALARAGLPRADQRFDTAVPNSLEEAPCKQ